MTPKAVTQSIRSAKQRDDMVQHRVVGACPANDSPGYRTQPSTYLVQKEHGSKQGHDPRKQPRTPGTVGMGGTLHPKSKRTEHLPPHARRQLRMTQNTTRYRGHSRPPVIRHNIARRQLHIMSSIKRSRLRGDYTLRTRRRRCSSRSHLQINQRSVPLTQTHTLCRLLPLR